MFRELDSRIGLNLRWILPRKSLNQDSGENEKYSVAFSSKIFTNRASLLNLNQIVPHTNYILFQFMFWIKNKSIKQVLKIKRCGNNSRTLRKMEVTSTTNFTKHLKYSPDYLHRGALFFFGCENGEKDEIWQGLTYLDQPTNWSLEPIDFGFTND